MPSRVVWEYEKALQHSIISYSLRVDIHAFGQVPRNRGTVPLFRAQLVWLSGSAESITAVSELSKALRLSGRESVNPAARWRLYLPGGGWM